jgi:hypothetical protein
MVAGIGLDLFGSKYKDGNEQWVPRKGGTFN